MNNQFENPYKPSSEEVIKAEEMMGSVQVEATAENQERSEAEKMAAETAKAEAEAIAQDEKAKQIEERKKEDATRVETLLAEIKSGNVEGVESQDQLASDYLAAYGEFRKIADKRSNDLRILDKLREEAIAPNLIAEQEELYASSRQGYEEAMKKYSKIGEKLTFSYRNEIYIKLFF